MPADYCSIRLLEGRGITEEIRKSFVIHLASHSRPMNELLNPVYKDIKSLFETQFLGMTEEDVALGDLFAVQRDLPLRIRSELNDNEKRFLLSIKQGQPDWNALGIPGLELLPALQWKLMNIKKMNPEKHNRYIDKLKAVLGA